MVNDRIEAGQRVLFRSGTSLFRNYPARVGVVVWSSVGVRRDLLALDALEREAGRSLRTADLFWQGLVVKVIGPKGGVRYYMPRRENVEVIA